MQANPNELAFFVAQGAVAALALAFMARSAFTRYSLFSITALCLIASFLPLSRGGTDDYAARLHGRHTGIYGDHQGCVFPTCYADWYADARARCVHTCMGA